MTTSSTASVDPDAVIKYKNRKNQNVESFWCEADLNIVVDGRPWRKFPWYLGQRNYSGVYWSVTERKMVGYESRLELAHLILADFNPAVKRIASQPFHLIFDGGGRKVRRTPDYLFLLENGARVVDAKPAEKLLNEKIRELLELTRVVVESAGIDYEVAVEPDEVFFANVRFLAGYRRDWLFEEGLLNEISCAAAEKDGITIGDLAAAVCRPKHAALPGIFHLMWRHRLGSDLTKVLSSSSILQARR
jgi:hypothetical protein